MKTYELQIETFTPAFAPNGDAALKDCRMETRRITGYRAAVAEAKAEAAKGQFGRCVILRSACGRGRKF